MLPPPSVDGKRMMLVSVDDNYLSLDQAPVDASSQAHVDKRPTDKERTETALKAAAARQSVGRIGRPGRARGKGDEIKALLNYTGTFSNVAATDNATVVKIQMSDSSEWASYIALYDEAIVDGGHIHFTQAVTTGYTSSNGATRAVVAYDPLDATALGSLSNGLIHQQHLEFSTAAGQFLTFPTIASRTGFWAFKWRTPRKSGRSSAQVTYFGHEWSSTSDAADLYGFLKWFIPQVGATGLYNVYYTWTLNVRFRNRT